MRLIKKLLLALSLLVSSPHLAKSYWWNGPSQVVRPSHDGVSATLTEEALLVRRPIQGGSGDTCGATIDPYPYPCLLYTSPSPRDS